MTLYAKGLRKIGTIHQKLALPTEQLLGAWTDARGRLQPESGLTKYGTAYHHRPGLLSLGTSTGSSPSPRAIAAATAKVALLRRSLRPESALNDLQEQLREEIRAAMAPERDPGVILTPSGTDGVYPALAIALSAGLPVENVIIEPGELGSGTLHAISGRHFTAWPPLTRYSRVVGAPLTGMPTARIHTTTIRARNPDGSPRSLADIDAAVESAVAAARSGGRQVLLHRVLHTKTGLILPGPECAERLSGLPGVDVLVDAVQGRISANAVQALLDSGAMLLMSGSKFYGAPPFAGLLLVPPALTDRAQSMTAADIPPGIGDYLTARDVPLAWVGWRAALQEMCNFGLLLRWSAALAEHGAYHRISKQKRDQICSRFLYTSRDVLGRVPGLAIFAETDAVPSCPPILCFTLTGTAGHLLGLPELLSIHAQLNLHHSIHLGRPITVSDCGPAVLRIALGASFAIDIAQGRAVEEMLAPLAGALIAASAACEAA